MMIILLKASTIIAITRFITGTVELICATIIFLKGDPQTIVKLSAILGILGPIALLAGLILGLNSLQDVSTIKIVLIFLGATFLIIGSFI